MVFILLYERGYFRSPGRGGENSKNAFPFFSIGRTTMRQCALERSMSQVYQTIFFYVNRLVSGFSTST